MQVKLTLTVADVVKDITKELSERQQVILKIIQDNPTETVAEMSYKTGVAPRTVIRELSVLQELGILTREGGRKEDHWVINVNKTNIFDKPNDQRKPVHFGMARK